jgi:hypothetical protein
VDLIGARMSEGVFGLWASKSLISVCMCEILMEIHECMYDFGFCIGLMLEMLSRLGCAKNGLSGMLLCNVVELVNMQELMVPKRAGRVRWNFGIGQLNYLLEYVSARQSLRE